MGTNRLQITVLLYKNCRKRSIEIRKKTLRVQSVPRPECFSELSRNFRVVRCRACGLPLSGSSRGASIITFRNQQTANTHHTWNDRMILFHENPRIIYHHSFHSVSRTIGLKAFRICSLLLSQTNAGPRSVRFCSGKKPQPCSGQKA